MLAIIAAVLFGLALIFDLANVTLGGADGISALTLLYAGLLLLALHLAGVGTGWRGGRR